MRLPGLRSHAPLHGGFMGFRAVGSLALLPELDGGQKHGEA